MRRILKKTAHFLLQTAVLGGLVFFAHASYLKQYQVPDPSQMRAVDNISETHPMAAAALVSRKSAVKVVSLSPVDYSFTSGSGTYVTYRDRYFVVTVAHGMNPECGLIKVLGAASNGEYTDCKKVIEINPYVDYAIIEVDKIKGLTAVDIAKQVPTTVEWVDSVAALSPLVYTGYPNDIGVLTFEGTVAAYSNDDQIYMHSYAWSGASGSGVFNKNGQLVGYIMALLVGETNYGPDVLEDIVIVVPLFNINWSIISHR
tara:strand:- start:559 stop:1332 length:774 start_codon:yes stop_codon:yes gene_type:complete